MERYRRLFLLTIVLIGLLFSSTIAAVGCGDDDETTSAKTETTATTTDSSTVVADRAIEVLASTETTGEYAANAIAADALSAKLADPAEKENLFLLDIRKMEDYDKGHIEGAVQMDFLDWAQPENLSQLPTDKKIIVICYTGNTAAQAASGMRVLGLDAAVLKGGMAGWEAGKSQSIVTDLQAANNAVVNDPPMMEAAPAPEATFTTPTGSDYDTLAMTMADVFGSMPEGAANVITAEDLKAKLDGGEADSLVLLDIRSTDDFTSVGHIEGAMNVPFKAVAVPENLDMLSKDKQVVVICYTGNTAAQTVTILKMLGYDAVSLKYGMMGWTQTPNTDGYIAYLNAANYPVVTGMAAAA